MQGGVLKHLTCHVIVAPNEQICCFTLFQSVVLWVRSEEVNLTCDTVYTKMKIQIVWSHVGTSLVVVVRTLGFHCRVCRFHPRLGN